MSSPSSPNRVWFITGTSSGLGKSILEAVLSNNERAIATCRNPSALSTLSHKYNTDSDKLLVLKLDVTNPDEIKAALTSGITKFGRIDVVVNNAGYGLFGEIEGTEEDEARYEFEVQFWGPVYILKETARIFREVNPKGSGGLIFNISAPGGYIAHPTLSYFSASKFALEAFTQSFLKEMSPSWNIKGCIVQPGTFPSKTWRSGNKTRTPHPAYTDPSNPCAMFSSLINSFDVIGDLNKMGKALVRLADLANGVRSEGLWDEFHEEEEKSFGALGALGKGPVDLPLRVQLGSDSQFLVRQQAGDTFKNAGEWAWFAHSTNVDGVDGQDYIRGMLKSGNFKDVEAK